MRTDLTGQTCKHACYCFAPSVRFRTRNAMLVESDTLPKMQSAKSAGDGGYWGAIRSIQMYPSVPFSIQRCVHISALAGGSYLFQIALVMCGICWIFLICLLFLYVVV